MHLNPWQPYLIAIVIGLLVGIEREKAHPKQKTMGVRTFLLISLLGAIAGGLQNQWLASLMTIFALGLILISYFTQSNSKASATDRGLTTEFAAGIVYCLGYAAHQFPALSAMIGPVVAMILFSKSSLHRFTHAIKPSELEAALFLLLGGMVVVNLVPNSVIDPWGILNPRKFGYLILTLATLEFSSYILTKIIGERAGSLLAGFLGGLVSSTAVLLSSARRASTEPRCWRSFFCSALIATLASFAGLFLIVGLISPALCLRIILASGAGFLFGAIALIYSAKKKEEHRSRLLLKSPLDWRGVFRLSFMLGTILAVFSLAQLWLGDRATFALSFLTGLFELHGAALANAMIYSQGQQSINTAYVSIILAMIASLVSKLFMCWMINRGIFARALTAVFLLMIAIIALAGWLILR